MPGNFNAFFNNLNNIQTSVPSLAEQKAQLLAQRKAEKVAKVNPEVASQQAAKDVYDSISKEKLNELLEYANYGRDEITAYRTAVISTLVKCLLKPYKGRIIISVLTYYSEVTTDYITVVNIVLIANDCHEDYELRGTIRKKIENIISESFPDISKNVFVNLMLGCIGR